LWRRHGESDRLAWWRFAGLPYCDAEGIEDVVEVTNVRLHFTPTHSSWLNQVELGFVRIEREVIARGIFTSVKDLARKLMRYIHAHSAAAKPFAWKYRDVNRRIHTKELTATVH
jgi:transposase